MLFFIPFFSDCFLINLKLTKILIKYKSEKIVIKKKPKFPSYTVAAKIFTFLFLAAGTFSIYTIIQMIQNDL